MAKDKDASTNGLVEYAIVPGDTYSNFDGYGTFKINLPHQGQIVVNRTLDYENIKQYYLTITASVCRINIFNVNFMQIRKQK